MWDDIIKVNVISRTGFLRQILQLSVKHSILCLLFFGTMHSANAQSIVQYSNNTTGSITDLSCNQPTSAQIVRTFTVATNYVVGDVDIGILLNHSYRSDLRIFLTSPAGTTVSLLPWTTNAQSGDHLNDLFDDESLNAILSHGATAIDVLTPVPPPYSHNFRPANPLSAFDGQNASGNWSLRICDAVGNDIGNFRRADLFLTATSLTVSKSSKIISDGLSLNNPKSVPGAIVEYCVLVTNNGSSATAEHTNLVMNDPLPAESSYVPGSLLSGTSCATATTIEDDDNSGPDENNPFGISIAGTTITGRATTLAANAVFAMVYRVTLN